MKVTIATMIWRRPEVFECFAVGVKNLIQSFPEIEFEVVAVGSEGEHSFQLAFNHGFTYHEYPNDNLGKKAQFRLDKVKETDPDYVLFLGSDDILTPSAFAYCIRHMNNRIEHIAPFDIYYLNRKRLYYSEGYRVGHHRHGEPVAPGRLLSASILNKLNWTLWDNSVVHRGLDSKAYARIKSAQNSYHYYSLKDIGAMLIDIKTSENLSTFNPKFRRNHFTSNISMVLPENLVDKINHIPE